jgi:hypothetical protein
MLHELMHRDLTGFKPMDFPATPALEEQIALSRQPHEAWWHEVLTEATEATWRSERDKEELHHDYTDWMRKLQRGYPITLQELSKFFVSLYGPEVLVRPRQTGLRIRPRRYRFPSLRESRTRFDPKSPWGEPRIFVRLPRRPS